MLQRQEETPTFFHYYLNTVRMSIAGGGAAILPYIGLPSVGNSALVNIFLIMVQISMLETRVVGLHCLTQHAEDTSSFLKCYLNAGQWLMPGITEAELHCI